MRNVSFRKLLDLIKGPRGSRWPQMHVDLCWFMIPLSSLMWPKEYLKMCHIFYHNFSVISRVWYVRYLAPARFSCQNWFYWLTLSIWGCWFKKIYVPFFSTTSSAAILNFKMAAINYRIYSYISTCEQCRRLKIVPIHRFVILETTVIQFL